MLDSLGARLRRGRRGTLSALAGNSVLFRALPDAPTGRLADAIGTALDGTVGVVLLASGVAWVVRHQGGRAISWSAVGVGLFLLTLATVGALVEWHTDG